MNLIKIWKILNLELENNIFIQIYRNKGWIYFKNVYVHCTNTKYKFRSYLPDKNSSIMLSILSIDNETVRTHVLCIISKFMQLVVADYYLHKFRKHYIYSYRARIDLPICNAFLCIDSMDSSVDSRLRSHFLAAPFLIAPDRKPRRPRRDPIMLCKELCKTPVVDRRCTHIAIFPGASEAPKISAFGVFGIQVTAVAAASRNRGNTRK